MPASRCRVTYTDSEGSHSVEVHADSLYEAVAMAVSEFKQDQTVPHPPDASTEVTGRSLSAIDRAQNQSGAGFEMVAAIHEGWARRDD